MWVLFDKLKFDDDNINGGNNALWVLKIARNVSYNVYFARLVQVVTLSALLSLFIEAFPLVALARL